MGRLYASYIVEYEQKKNGNWEWIIETLKPDYILAQEAGPLPPSIKATTRTTTKKSNRSAFYSRLNDHIRIDLESDHGMGLLVTKTNNIFFICVYTNLYFKPVHPPLLGYIASFVSSLRRRHDAKNILIAGDFNMDRRMDENPTGTRFAKKWTYPKNDFFNAIQDMGFQDCILKFYSEPVQTHRHNRSEFPWQLDHMFATRDLYDHLQSIQVISAQSYSDHDLILADFK
jgi:exonuclease III